MPSNRLILCRPLLLLPSIFPSIGIFSSELAVCIRWPKYWSFSFSISPSSEYSELISFRIDWFDLLAVQVTLKSLLHHHSSKASILWQKKPPKQMAENKSPGLSEGPRAPGLRISSSSRPNKYRWALPYTSARGAVWPHCSPCPKTTTISSRGAGGYRLSREALLLLLPEMSWSCSRLESGAGVTQGFCWNAGAAGPLSLPTWCCHVFSPERWSGSRGSSGTPRVFQEWGMQSPRRWGGRAQNWGSFLPVASLSSIQDQPRSEWDIHTTSQCGEEYVAIHVSPTKN